MSRQNRFFSSPRPTTVETSNITFQSRYLLRPGPRLNRLAVGALAKAQELYPVRVHAFCFLSNHWHVLATYDDPKQMADFHCHFQANLSREAQIEHRWKGSVFQRRYHHVELSREPGIELARLKYVLAQGCKEGLVASPLDWPGASSTEALLDRQPAEGIWVDRTALNAAERRGENVTEDDFTEVKHLVLEPLPGQAHLSPEAYRQIVLDKVTEIETETAAKHAVEKTQPTGAGAVLSRNPHHEPENVSKSPRPWFHAMDREVRRAMRTALTLIAVAYREAVERLKAGDRKARFPEHTFPPGLPFVRSAEAAASG